MPHYITRKPPLLPASAAVIFSFDTGMWLLDDFAGLTWYGAAVLLGIGAALVAGVESTRLRATRGSTFVKAAVAALAIACPLAVAGPCLAAASLVWWFLAGGAAVEPGASVF
jgi:hypothetical protein